MYQQKDLEGDTYTTVATETGETTLGNSVTPPVYPYEGFISPQEQTVVIDKYNKTIIYKYERKTYTLTINDSNYVTTNTPTGTYPYGSRIHLVANETDSSGQPFVKWSNNNTNRDYTFTLTKDTTIGPIYAETYTITYEHNNGNPQTTQDVIKTHPIGSLPSYTFDDCQDGTGSYLERSCTYVFEIEGWYKEETFDTKVDENFVPTENTTLYAKWNKIFYAYYGSKDFDGTTDSFIDTGIKIFSELNAYKNFTVTFTVNTNNGYNHSTGERGTIFTDMNERGEPYPGVQFFTEGSDYTMNVNILGNKKKNNNTGYETGQKVVIKKVDGLVYYSYDDGEDVLFNDFTNFNQYFDNHASFGAGTNNQGRPYRYFIGTLSDMSVELSEPASYSIHFDANGGIGTMNDQIVRINKSTNLSTNTFTHDDASFGGWNTEPDGSGTSYSNRDSILNLGNKDEVVTLYAQWIPTIHYYVHFDANGGTGTMEDQRFNYDSIPATLNPYAFTRPGYIFKNWNTKQDGSGTAYEDEASVVDLTDEPDGIVNLYAQYKYVAYEQSGDIVFDGTSNTFIDTGLNIFSDTNLKKDFEIRFTFKSVDEDVFDFTPEQPTLFNAKDESNTSKYPGINIRFNGVTTIMTPTYRWGGNTVNYPTNGIATSNAPIEFIYRRKNEVITMQYIYGSTTSEEHTIITQKNWNLNKPFTQNVSFGGYFDKNNVPGRFFKGTLSDISIIIDE